MSPNMCHFEALRAKINQRLRRIDTVHARRQINEFPWLYGALGQVPSEVMLICENPSLLGVEKAGRHPINGKLASIEDQWCGDRHSNCIKRLRPALCAVGLKTTPPHRPGGWHCYLTNVIKEADVVRDFAARDKRQLAVEWADVLAWELDEVQPKLLFAVGGIAFKLVGYLQARHLIPASPAPLMMMHYSNRGRGVTDAVVRDRIIEALTSGLSNSAASVPDTAT